MKIKSVLSEINNFDGNTLVTVCYFGGAFSLNYYKKIVGIKQIDIMSDKLPGHKNIKELTKAICLVASELDNNIDKALCVKDISVTLDQFDPELELYCVDDNIDGIHYSFVSEICCIIDANEDPDLKEFRESNNKCNILEFVV